MFLLIPNVILFNGNDRLDERFMLAFTIVVNGAIVPSDHNPCVFALK
jgi:hypothetical protein